jgi:hypothetical protein
VRARPFKSSCTRLTILLFLRANPSTGKLHHRASCSALSHQADVLTYDFADCGVLHWALTGSTAAKSNGVLMLENARQQSKSWTRRQWLQGKGTLYCSCNTTAHSTLKDDGACCCRLLCLPACKYVAPAGLLSWLLRRCRPSSLRLLLTATVWLCRLWSWSHCSCGWGRGAIEHAVEQALHGWAYAREDVGPKHLVPVRQHTRAEYYSARERGGRPDAAAILASEQPIIIRLHPASAAPVTRCKDH